MYIFADFHTHTLYSHGKGTVEENLLAGKARGLEMVAITDHGPGSVPWVRTSLRRMRRMMDEVRFYNQRLEGIRALAGVEANVVSLRGEIDVPPDLVEELDLLLVGFHTEIIARTLAEQWKIFGRTLLARHSRAAAERARADVTQALVEIVYRHPVDIVTHPGHKVSIETAALARACARRGTAMEINAGHGFMTRAYAEIAALEGAPFVLDSDAHRPGDVGRLERALAVAQAAGLQPEQIWNARETADEPRPGEGLPHRPGRVRPNLDGLPPRWDHSRPMPGRSAGRLPQLADGAWDDGRDVFNPDVDTEHRGPWRH